jgi:regulatory protein
LDESRFARAYAGGKFRTKSWGRNRIARELKLRGLNDRLIKEGLAEIPEEEYEVVLDKLSRKRLKELAREKDKWRKRKKFVDYLLYRGWEPELVYEKVNELLG